MTSLIVTVIQFLIAINCCRRRLHLLGDGSEHHLSKMYRSSFEYNNWMVSLAGYILEQLTGNSWEDEIRKNYFIPLNMTTADFIHTAENYDDFALTAFRIAGLTSGTTEWLSIDPTFIR